MKRLVLLAASLLSLLVLAACDSLSFGASNIQSSGDGSFEGGS